MSLLEKMQNLKKASSIVARTAMTDEQVAQCKSAIRQQNLGYNVHPNRFDIDAPYRVAVNYDKTWSNYGNFSNKDVAAAIGSIVSSAFFGENAVAGEFDAKVAEGHDEFKAWMADPRNTEVIAKASGEKVVVTSDNKQNPFMKENF